MNDLPEHVERSIRSRRLFRRRQPILVAVSGGLDSMVLLHLLHALSKEAGWRLTVAHLNHRLRGRSSDADERFVREAAEKLGLPFVSDQADVRKFARAHKLSLEMAARKLRHDFLARMAIGLKIPTVALAHHADDQLELFFLRLLRGSGGEGLAGMKWIAPSPGNVRSSAFRRSGGQMASRRLKAERQTQLVRPLLDLSKAALRAYAAQEKIPFREDASNALLDIRRNRIRHELLPLLQKQFQPALDKTIPRVMEIIGAEADFVSQTAESWLKKNRRTAFENLAVAVQRRCLQLQLIGHGIAPDFDLIEQLRSSAHRQVSVSPELTVNRDAQGRIRLQKVERSPFKPGRTEADLEGRNGKVVFDNVKIAWSVDSSKTFRRPGQAAGREYFDADKIGSVAVLRHWQPGDRFQPIGMSRPVKLQDLFTNQKIPRAQRRRLVVAATGGGEVFWVEGLRLGERFKLDERSVHRLKWTWQRD